MTWQALAQEKQEVVSLVTLAALALVSAEGQLTEERLASGVSHVFASWCCVFFVGA